MFEDHNYFCSYLPLQQISSTSFYLKEVNKPGNRNLDNDLSQYWQTRGFLHSFKNCKINVQTWKFVSFYAITWLLATTKENKRNWSLGYIYEKYLFIWFKCILQNCGFQNFHVNVPLSTCLGFIIIKCALHYFAVQNLHLCDK